MDILEFENRDSQRSNGMIKIGGKLRTLTKSSIGSQDSTSQIAGSELQETRRETQMESGLACEQNIPLQRSVVELNRKLND